MSKKVLKKMKNNGGKAEFEGPNVKVRKHSAPPTQFHRKKKGKGSYDRKKLDESEDKEELHKFVSAILNDKFETAREHLTNVINNKLGKRMSSELNTPLF